MKPTKLLGGAVNHVAKRGDDRERKMDKKSEKARERERERERERGGGVRGRGGR